MIKYNHQVALRPTNIENPSLSGSPVEISVNMAPIKVISDFNESSNEKYRMSEAEALKLGRVLR